MPVTRRKTVGGLEYKAAMETSRTNRTTFPKRAITCGRSSGLVDRRKTAVVTTTKRVCARTRNAVGTRPITSVRVGVRRGLLASDAVDT